jgi:lipid A 4'-phosphatase
MLALTDRSAGRASTNPLLALQVSALICGALAGIAFVAFPSIDLTFSQLFYSGEGVFVGQSLPSVSLARSAFAALFYVSIAATLAGLLITHSRARTWLQLAFPHWLYLAICLAVGPGLVANVVLKDHFGRPRPKQVIEFGGSKAFSPALIPSRECASNCSFISGEAASTFLPFFAASAVLPQAAPLLIALGMLCGVVSGLVRVAQGAHFLSDIVFAAVCMALTAACVHSAMFGRTVQRSRPRPGGINLA